MSDDDFKRRMAEELERAASESQREWARQVVEHAFRLGVESLVASLEEERESSLAHLRDVHEQPEQYDPGEVQRAKFLTPALVNLFHGRLVAAVKSATEPGNARDVVLEEAAREIEGVGAETFTRDYAARVIRGLKNDS